MIPGLESPIEAGPRLWGKPLSAIRQRLTSVDNAAGVIFSLAICAVPVSIAITELLLGAALLLRMAALWRGKARMHMPRIFWFWLMWAALEIVWWSRSTDLRAGWGEIRHLALPLSVILILPAQRRRVMVWRGIFLAATLSSLVLIVEFAARLKRYTGSGDPVVYLRNGGLLNHWMVYGTVEVLVFAGLLEFWHLYPEERRRWLPVFAINGLAIVLSLTRMLWICCIILLAVHLLWRRSKWILALPVLAAAVYVLSPGVVRTRLVESSQWDYYSNTERLQMLQVGWRMIVAEPVTGVGPGRVEKRYTSYLSTKDPIPAYHGHLHNNLVQLAAEFGLPVAAAAVLFTIMLFGELRKRYRAAETREERFVCSTSLLALAGFLASGAFDYTYGHALGIILLSFAVFSPVIPAERLEELARGGARIGAAADRILGAALAVGSLPVVIVASVIVHVLSRRSPLVAHLRAGYQGQPLWVLKLRTMWPATPPRPEESGWIQKIEANPPLEGKVERDPRVTSRAAAFCRRHSIDELPQLWHVMRGEMSLVGPRPLTYGELTQHYGDRTAEVLSVKPGLTGYWQIQGRNRLTYAERMDHDLRLIQELSLSTFVRVLLRTIPEVVGGRNAW